MTGWPKSVWVIVKHGGYEGYELPKMVFSTKEEADQVLEIASDSGLWKVHEVPFWIPADHLPPPPEDT